MFATARQQQMLTTEVPMLDLLAHQEDRGPVGSLLTSAAREVKARAKALSYLDTSTFKNKQAFCIVQLCQMPFTHTQGQSRQDTWRSESPKGCGRTVLKTCIGNRLPSPHLQQHLFYWQSPKVGNFRLGKKRTIAFHYQLASVYISKGFLKGGFNSLPHLSCILHSYYYTLLSWRLNILTSLKCQPQ